MADLSELGLALFLAAGFAAAVVAGMVGFAFGIIAAAIWAHLLAPAQTAALIVGFALLIQGQSIWRLRHALDARRLLPFLLGGLIGVPLGIALLRAVAASHLRTGVGIVLIVFCLNALLRPNLRPLTWAGRGGDMAVGVLSGVLGGATGLAGILPTIWCGFRGWSRDEQRAVFQPVAGGIFLMTALGFGVGGTVDGSTLHLFLLGLPAVLAGTWLGLRLYGKLNETGFRRAVLALLLLSGVALVVRP